jgi:hypothetical protein
MLLLSPVLAYSNLRKIKFLESEQQVQYRIESITCCFGLCRLRLLNIIGCVFSAIASFGLCGLGIVPLLEGDMKVLDPTQSVQIVTLVHLGSTSVFFITIFIHMVLGSITSFWIDRKLYVLGKAPEDSKLMKRFGISFWTIYKVLCTFGIIGVIVMTQILGVIIVVTQCDMESLSTNTCTAVTTSSAVLGALNQYSLITLVILYLVSYMNELKHSYLEFHFESDYDNRGIALEDQNDAILLRDEEELEELKDNEEVPNDEVHNEV